MARFAYDRSSKWMLQHHGDALLRLGGVRDLAEWRAIQSEVVQPRQLPDGLLEARRAGEERLNLYVVELSTYPDLRVMDQVVDDVMLVYQDRRVVPEVLVLVLHSKGNLRVADSWQAQSREGWTGLRVNWRVVELWTLPAEELLATQDPGLMPWVPLTQFDGPPAPIFQRCREVVDRKASLQELANLLAVSEVLAGLRYDDPNLLAIFGGKEAMLESPVLQRLLQERVAQSAHGMIRDTLRIRFGRVPDDLVASLTEITDEARLHTLHDLAVSCPSLEAFRQHLSP